MRELIVFQDAFERFLDIVSTRQSPIETLPVVDSCGRILAEDITARVPMPPFDKTAMDGYAILSDDSSTDFEIIETLGAGDLFTQSLAIGKCTKIMTGGMVPPGTGRVIPVENADEIDGHVHFTHRGSDTHLCYRGEDFAEGALLGRSGNRITPALAAILISCGADQVAVRSHPTGRVFSTGNELIEPGAPLPQGRIYDSNGPMLDALLRQHDVTLTPRGRIPDDLDASIRILAEATRNHDVICLSGGVSAGDFDYIPRALEACGMTLHFSGIRVKPGKPMTVATSDRCLVMAFPGNPVSTFVMFHLFGIPALNAIAGRRIHPRFMTLRLDNAFRRKHAERLEFVPARLTPDGISQIPYHGSAHLAALALVEGFLVIPPGISRIDAGESAQFWPIALTGYETSND